MKRVIIDKNEIIEYGEKKVRVPLIIGSILGIMYERQKDKWDNEILITGEVGSAKSTMAKLIAGLWHVMINKELTIDNFAWSAKKVVECIDKEGNDTEGVIFDESIKGGTGRASLTKEGNLLKIGLVVGRRKRHLYIMIVDELKEFSEKIISRSSLLIDMRTLLVKGKETRGYFKIYGKDELREIYSLLKDKRIRYISEYSATSKPFYKFTDISNVFINEEEYEQEKIEQTRQQEEEKQDKKDIAVKNAIKYLSKTGLTQAKIANILGYSRGHIGDLIRDDGVDN